jgi:hypothetical protein
MVENKTRLTEASVQNYLEAIGDETRRKDCAALTLLLSEATNYPAAMWGASIVGFGSYRYKYESGREGEMCIVGFSSRKGDISLYGLNAAKDAEELLARLGKHKVGKGCVYIKTLADVDQNIIKTLAARAVAVKGGRGRTHSRRITGV